MDSQDIHHPLPAQSSQSKGVTVLQWLTYALWGWMVLAIMALVYVDLAYFFLNDDPTEIVLYGAAAVLVLAPLTFGCDIAYARKEPASKTGAAVVVAIVHAVLFALLSIGMLLAIAFVSQFLGSNPSVISGPTIVLMTLMIGAILFGATFLRVLPIVRTSTVYRLSMAVVVGVVSVVAVVGPVARLLITQDDRLITAHIRDLNDAVEQYVGRHHKLPTSVADLSLTPEAKMLLNKGLVKFKPADKQTVVDQTDGSGSSVQVQSFVVSDDYRYQLCAIYKEAAGNGVITTSVYDKDADGYQTYLSVYDHPAGEVCYKLVVNVGDR